MTDVPKQAVGAAQLAAGGGGGGVLVYLINNYVADAGLQTLLLYIVPAVSVVAATLYVRAVDLMSDYVSDLSAERRRKQLLERAQRGLAEAKSQLKSIEMDEHATAQHKVAARDRVQAFERAVLDLHAKDIVTIDTAPLPLTTDPAR